MSRATSPLKDRVIFVEGAPRSGTTWLVTLLSAHPAIAGVEAESHLFDFGVDRLFDNLEGRDPNLHGLAGYLDREQLVDLARDLCDGVLTAMSDHVAGGTAPEYVVEKTPVGATRDGRDLQRKADIYPDAWHVHIVRDREAVTRSLMRAPFMADRSYEACSGLWDRTVGHIREHTGGRPRYREISYEHLRSDPAAACRELFDWIGIPTDETTLETIRVLSRDSYSDLGAVSTTPAVRRTPTALLRGLARRLRGAASAKPAPPHPLAFRLVSALRARDADALREMTSPKLEFVQRAPAGDVSVRGDEARDALVALAEATFTGRYVGEWWTTTGVGAGEWWTTAPGRPVCTLVFSALGGDATRVDLALAVLLDGDLIGRATVISAGPLTGRPILPARQTTTV